MLYEVITILPTGDIHIQTLIEQVAHHALAGVQIENVELVDSYNFV